MTKAGGHANHQPHPPPGRRRGPAHHPSRLARADCCDRRGRYGPAELDHHPDRGPADPSRPRRLLRRSGVVHRRLHAGDVVDAAARQPARRHAGPAPRAAGRHRRLRRRLDSVRTGAERHDADRRPLGAGGGRRDHGAAGLRAHPGGVRRSSPAEGIRGVRAGDGPGRRDRTAARRRPGLTEPAWLRLARNLPGQRAARSGRDPRRASAAAAHRGGDSERSA